MPGKTVLKTKVWIKFRSGIAKQFFATMQIQRSYTGMKVVKVVEQAFKWTSWSLNHGVAINQVKHVGPVVIQADTVQLFL